MLPVNKLSALVLTLFIGYLQGYAQNTFIQGHLTDMHDGDLIYLTSYPLGNQTPLRIDSAKIIAGNFDLKTTIPSGEGSVYYLTTFPIKIAHNGQIIVDSDQRNQLKYIYLQEGRLTITGSGINLAASKLSGDQFAEEQQDLMNSLAGNKQLSDWMVRSNAELQRISMDSSKGSVPMDSSAFFILLASHLRRTLCQDWVLQHLNSPFSPFVLWKVVGTDFMSAQLDERDSILHLMSPEALNNKVGRFLEDWWDKEFWIPKQTREGMKAPEFLIQRNGQKPISLKDYKGKYVIVNFHYCANNDAFDDQPGLNEAWNNYKDKGVYFLDIGMNIEGSYHHLEPDKLIRPDRFHFQYAIYNQPGVKEMDAKYGGSKYFSYVIDPKGIIVARNILTWDLNTWLQDHLR